MQKAMLLEAWTWSECIGQCVRGGLWTNNYSNGVFDNGHCTSVPYLPTHMSCCVKVHLVQRVLHSSDLLVDLKSGIQSDIDMLPGSS